MLQSCINNAILSYHTDHSKPPGPLTGLRIRSWCHKGHWYQITLWQELLKSYKEWLRGEQGTVLLPPPRWAGWRWKEPPAGGAGHTHCPPRRTCILDSPTHTWKFRHIASTSSKLMLLWSLKQKIFCLKSKSTIQPTLEKFRCNVSAIS